MQTPIARPRRLRQSAAIRKMVGDTHLSAANLVQPLFVMDGRAAAQPIASLPGHERLNISDLVRHAASIQQLGIAGVALFPAVDPALKTPLGEEALNADNLILRAIRAVKSALPDLLVFADIALDPYTAHGHDGVLTDDGKDVDNDRTVAILAAMAVLTAQAGADFVAPSDMMDGRVGAIRHALDAAGAARCGILSYCAKFDSAYYGPFRDAVGSANAAKAGYLSKATYQMDPACRLAARRERLLDEAEGADLLMVKPAGPYLDVIRDFASESILPIAAYQVSGEFAQILAAGQLGWLNPQRARDESLLAIRRAGAAVIFSYFARAWAKDQLA